MTQTIPECPHCGVVEEVYVNCRPRGKAKRFYNVVDGSYEGVDLDEMWFDDFSGVLRCGKCGKIRRDIERKDGMIKPK